MDLPKIVRVGYRDYTVEQWPTAHAAGSQRFGECDKNLAIIRVDIGFGAAKAANTLLHEVLHAAYYQAALEDGDNEERVVSALSNQITQVWRDNPDLVAYVTEALKVEQTYREVPRHHRPAGISFQPH